MEQSQPPGRELEEEESEDAMDMERQQHTRGPDNTLINSSSRNRSSTSSSTSSCALQPLLSSSTPSTSHHKESSFDQLHSSPPLLSEISRRRGGVVLPSPPSPSPPPGQSTPSPFRRGISFGGATLHTTCTSEGSTREKNAKSNISSKVESENFADAHAAGGGGLPPFLAPANSFRRLAAAATTAKRWSTGGRHRAGAKGGRAGRRETAKSAPRLSSLEEVMNVKYEPPPDEEGVEAAATKAAARDGKRKGWKWLPRRAAFLVKALPKDVKRVHRRDQPRVLLLWYLLLVVFVSWCLFVLIKIVDDRNTPAQAIRRDDASQPDSIEAHEDILAKLDQLPSIIACYPSFGGKATWVPASPQLHYWRWKEEGEDEKDGKVIDGRLHRRERRRRLRSRRRGAEDKAVVGEGEEGGEEGLPPEVNPDGTPLQPTPPLERMFTHMTPEVCPVLQRGRTYQSCIYFHGNDLVPTREGSLQDRGLELYLSYIRERGSEDRMVYR
ncbi:Hypothetical protein NocV09_13900020 [Nannochloropsis oceanica]